MPGRQVATLLTQVVVDPTTRLRDPTKPIGPIYDQRGGRAWSATADGRSARDGARSWRRVVASPEPRRIVELATIRLLRAGMLVVCVGGGGIPVDAAPATVSSTGSTRSSTRTSPPRCWPSSSTPTRSLLLTDVPAVQVGWGTGQTRTLRRATPAELRARDFAAGSMGPKVEAAARFAERTGRRAAIGSLDEADLLLDGIHGTTVGHG